MVNGMVDGVFSEELLHRLSDVLAGPLASMPQGLSAMLEPFVSHSALIVFSADVSGGRVHGAGDASFVRGVRGVDLDRLRRDVDVIEGVRYAAMRVDDGERMTMQVLARNGALLVLADPGPVEHSHLILDIWHLVSLHVQERADEAAPDYLQHARSASGARFRALTELADESTATLESVLATLRSNKLGDSQARGAAIDAATEGLVRLRNGIDHVRTLTEEPVTTAFARLKKELRSAANHSDIGLHFVDPPADGRALPDEIARGARAVARRAILSRVEVPEISRVRVQWDCDGVNLLMGIRDDGPGTSQDADLLLRAAKQRVHAMRGRVSVEATPGWGTEMLAVIPLDPPRARVTSSLARLRPREVQVAELLVEGQSNRAIAERLGISENTVKFHVSRILQSLKAGSRSEAMAMLLAEQQN